MQFRHNKTLRGNASERATLNDFYMRAQCWLQTKDGTARVEKPLMGLSALDAWLQLTHLNAFKNIAKLFDGLA